MSRIIIPAAFDAQRKLFGAINIKVTADGASSVLGPFMTQQGISLSADAAAGAEGWK